MSWGKPTLASKYGKRCCLIGNVALTRHYQVGSLNNMAIVKLCAKWVLAITCYDFDIVTCGI